MPDQIGTPEVTAEARCAECNTSLSEGQDRETTEGGVFCRPCYNNLSMQLHQVMEAQGAGINYSMALVGGLAGGAVGALAWWGFTVLTEISFGLVAIVIGFTVGWGVMRFAGNKRSVGLQGLSVGLAAASFFYASYLVNRTFLLRAFAQRGEPIALPFFPPPEMFFQVLKLNFGFMDVVFLAIVVYEAWKIPRPLKLAA